MSEISKNRRRRIARVSQAALALVALWYVAFAVILALQYSVVLAIASIVAAAFLVWFLVRRNHRVAAKAHKRPHPPT